MHRLKARFIMVNGIPRQDWAIDIQDGLIAHCGPAHALAEPAHPVHDLGEVALLPGQVNAHSHAFQRSIRGHTEWLHSAREDEDFWSWRTAMYGAALSLSPDDIEAIAGEVYEEMALAGITHVGEFHYLHHDLDGSPYADPNELAHRVIRAARRVGLKLTLLRVAYHRAGHGLPVDPMQRRFVEPDVHTYLQRFEALRGAWTHDAGVSFGLAPHSIRAVPEPWLVACAHHAREHELPLHIHACEQRAEIAQALAEYGRTPLQVFHDAGMFEANLTLVHATHLTLQELELLETHGATVCACPTTERNLGDGFLPALELMKRRVAICVGSDSHTSVDPWEELRLIEYHERLRHERRNVLAASFPVWFPQQAHQERWDTARLLWPMGSVHGARALGSEAGELSKGAPADLVSVSLAHPSLRGSGPESVASNVIFSMSPGAVQDVWVSGEKIVSQGRLAATS